MERLSPKEAFEVFSNFINSGYGDEFDEFVDLATSDHRALQADYFRVMLKCIDKWHDMYKNGSYDARNQNEVRYAYEIIEALKGKNLY